MIERNEIKNNLPYGSISEVAKRANVSKGAVTRFLNGETKSSPKIEKAALEVAFEYQKTIKKLVDKLKSISE